MSYGKHILGDIKEKNKQQQRNARKDDAVNEYRVKRYAFKKVSNDKIILVQQKDRTIECFNGSLQIR